jgi:hypothetical protein
VKRFAEGFGIGAALMAALGVVSLFFKPGLLGLTQVRPASRARPAATAGVADARQTPLPPDFLDLCRASGL